MLTLNSCQMTSRSGKGNVLVLKISRAALHREAISKVSPSRTRAEQKSYLDECRSTSRSVAVEPDSDGSSLADRAAGLAYRELINGEPAKVCVWMRRT